MWSIEGMRALKSQKVLQEQMQIELASVVEDLIISRWTAKVGQGSGKQNITSLIPLRKFCLRSRMFGKENCLAW